jgi:hypothetical protein
MRTLTFVPAMREYPFLANGLPEYDEHSEDGDLAELFTHFELDDDDRDEDEDEDEDDDDEDEDEDEEWPCSNKGT